jgi:acyl-CoA thioesterase YciA
LYTFEHQGNANKTIMSTNDEQPQGELTIRVLAMPADMNPSGDIFGGWILSQMDIAGGVFSRKLVKDRVVTISVESTTFKLPVFVGDTLCCYVSVSKKGRTSICVKIEAWVNRDGSDRRIKVTEGEFTYVNIDSNRKPSPIDWDLSNT